MYIINEYCKVINERFTEYHWDFVQTLMYNRLILLVKI